MSDWEIKSIQNQLDRLDKKVWKESTINFVWLMILSNVVFWLFIFNISLKHDFNASQANQQLLFKTSEVAKK